MFIACNCREKRKETMKSRFVHLTVLFVVLFFVLLLDNAINDINERSDGVKREREVGSREKGPSFVSFDQREGRKG